MVISSYYIGHFKKPNIVVFHQFVFLSWSTNLVDLEILQILKIVGIEHGKQYHLKEGLMIIISDVSIKVRYYSYCNNNYGTLK